MKEEGANAPANGRLSAEEPSASHGDPGGAGAEGEYCRKCAISAPRGTGNCPKCGCTMLGNQKGRKHPVRLERRAEILDLVNTQSPAENPSQQFENETLAAAMERLEGMRLGSPEWQRVFTTVRMLSADVAARGPRPRADSPLPGLREMPSSALLYADGLLSRREKGETLTERELGQLDVLEPAMRGELRLPPDPPRAGLAESDEAARRRTNEPTTDPACPLGEAPALEAPGDPDRNDDDRAEADTACAYCGLRRGACAAIREMNIDAWRAMHSTDPREEARENREAMSEMIAGLTRRGTR